MTRLKVLVDGVMLADVPVNATATPVEYLLVEASAVPQPLLGRKFHHVEVYKATEDTLGRDNHNTPGVVQFYRFTVTKGKFGPKPPPLQRKFEFIGDSDTAGWCADGVPHGHNVPSIVEDGYWSWAQQLSRELGAESMVEAISGYGVTTNSTPIQTVLNNVNTYNPNVKWNYGDVPDAVILLIGPNDKPGSGFIEGYLNLLSMIVDNYRHVTRRIPLINVCGGSINGLDVCESMYKANDIFNAQSDHPHIVGHNVAIEPAHWLTINWNDTYKGCSNHYNRRGHAVLVQDILSSIETILSDSTAHESRASALQ
jgi:hypothetical protein